MATLTAYGDNYTIADNVTPSTLLNPAKWTGDIKHVTDVIDISTAADAASIIYVGKLPKGAVPLYTIFNSDDATSTATGIIGYTGDTNALGTISAMVTTPVQVVIPIVKNTALTAAKDVFVTTADDTMSTSIKWHVTIAYGMEG